MARLNLTPLAVSFVSVVFVISCIQSYLYYGLDRGDTDACTMTWSRPVYRRVRDFTSAKSRMGSRYNLFLYGEWLVDKDDEAVVSENGVPVLFVPGNAGTHSQGRSLASFCSKRTEFDRGAPDRPNGGSARGKAKDQARERAKFRGKEFNEEEFDKHPPPDELAPKFDFFLADFNEDFTAFHGRTLLDQAQYLNDAIAHILSMYDGHDNPPKSVIIVGHSMGGIVARALVTLPNYVPDSVNTIITLSAPHTLPPLSFDGDIVAVYDKVNQFWRRAFSENANGRSAFNLSSMSLISITGGPSDAMVPSDYTSVSTLVPPSNGFSVFTHSIPGVWTGIDHLAIVWCEELRNAVGNALFDIADYSSPYRTLPIFDRMQEFRRSLLSGLEKKTDPYRYQAPSRRLVVDEWTENAVTVSLGNEQKMHITEYDKRATFFYKSSIAGPSAMFCHRLGDREEDHSVNLTSIHKNDFTNARALALQKWNELKAQSKEADITKLNVDNPGVELLCRQLEDGAASLPAPYDSEEHPFRSEKRLLVRLVNEAYDQDPILIRFSTKQRDYHAVVDVPLESGSIEVTDSWMRLSRGYREIPLGAHFTEISLPGTASSLITYSVVVNSNFAEFKTCTIPSYFENFQGIIRQSLDGDSEESKLHLNILNKTSSLISAHAPSPYMPYLSTPSLNLQVILPSVICTEQLKEDGPQRSPYSLFIRVDIRASLANIVLRYRTLFAIFPLAIAAIIVTMQFLAFASKGVFISFGEAIALYTRFPLLATVVAAASVHILVCINPIRGLLVAFRLPYEGKNLAAMKAFNSLLEQNDVFLGISEPSLWPLASMFVLTAAGICFALFFAITQLVDVLAIGVNSILPVPRTRQISDDMEKTNVEKYLTVHSIDRREVLKQLTLLSAVVYWIPYQVSFLGATIWQVVNVVQLHRVRLSKGPGERKADSNGYNFAVSLMILFIWCSAVDAPVLVVWIRNLSPRWAISFASIGNIVNVLPIFAAIHISRDYSLPRLTTTKKHITVTILLYMASYAFLHGFLHTYVLHHLVNIFCLWVLVLWVANS